MGEKGGWEDLTPGSPDLTSQIDGSLRRQSWLIINGAELKSQKWGGGGGVEECQLTPSFRSPAESEGILPEKMDFIQGTFHRESVFKQQQQIIE